MEQVNVNDFISKIVNANIKRVIEQVKQLQIEVKALKERMDHTEKNVVNNMESAVFMNKITAEIYKRIEERLLKEILGKIGVPALGAD